MHDGVHVGSEKVAGVGQAQQAQAGGVAEDTVAVKVDAVNPLRRGIEQQPESLLALEQCLFRARAVSNFRLQHLVGSQQLSGALFHAALQLVVGFAQ